MLSMPNCKKKLKTLFIIDCLPVNTEYGKYTVSQQLESFFDSTTSDLYCSNCEMLMMRKMKVLNWPNIILIYVNEPTTSHPPVHRCPPSVVSLHEFTHNSNIPILSSATYDLTTFISVVPVHQSKKLVSATKINKKWATSTARKLDSSFQLVINHKQTSVMHVSNLALTLPSCTTPTEAAQKRSITVSSNSDEIKTRLNLPVISLQDQTLTKQEPPVMPRMSHIKNICIIKPVTASPLSVQLLNGQTGSILQTAQVIQKTKIEGTPSLIGSRTVFQS
ncbi:unnamed protein product [Didymodactylos carnosus]|uniref:Uncharacterized protein n=1 Tax=Didymodactylos carnosus TaxID=1234261 RepID=A0A8S2I328_9BILA|nr:unnamed protein product [Didymodactylos carnosus]